MHLCINVVPKEANEQVVMFKNHYIHIKLWRRVLAARNCSIKLKSLGDILQSL